MLQILCLALCGLLTRTRAESGALLRLGMDILNHGELVGLGGRLGRRWLGQGVDSKHAVAAHICMATYDPHNTFISNMG